MVNSVPRNMDARYEQAERELEGYRDLCRQITHFAEMIKEKEEQATFVRSNLDPDRTSGGKADYERPILDIVEMQKVYAQKRIKAIEKSIEIEAIINQIRNERDARLLRKYYIQGMTDFEIAETEFCDRSTITRLRRGAIMVYAKIAPKKQQTPAYQ